MKRRSESVGSQHMAVWRLKGARSHCIVGVCQCVLRAAAEVRPGVVGKGHEGQADTSVECGLGGSFSMRKAGLEDNLSP